MAGLILCCGEALIDMLPRDLDGEDVFLPVPGGAIFNTAIALGRLGEPVGFLSGISTDMFGKQLLEALTASNVEIALAVRSDQPTTLAFVKLIDGHAQYSFFDENSAGRFLDKADLPTIPEDVDALQFGAISLIPEPSGSAFEHLLTREAGHRVIALDPNIRPGFIEDAGAHRDRISRMAELSDIIKVSDEDLDWITNGGDHQEQVNHWISKNTSVVLLTMGSKGVRAYTREGSIDVPAQKAEVVDTIGAGDTFNAGFLAGLRRSDLLTKMALASASLDQLRPALELAGKVAAFTVSQAGANPPWQYQLIG